MKNVMFKHFVFRRSFSGSYFELCRTRRKRLYILQEINPRWLQMKKCLFMKNWGWDQTHRVYKSPLFDRKSPVFEESMKERWSTYEHFPLCGSAWGAIWGRLLKKEFPPQIGFQKSWCFWTFWEGDFEHFLIEFCKLVRILAWNRDGKWWEGPN